LSIACSTGVKISHDARSYLLISHSSANGVLVQLVQLCNAHSRLTERAKVPRSQCTLMATSRAVGLGTWLRVGWGSVAAVFGHRLLLVSAEEL